MQRRTTARAFTLAELLCALAVMSVLMLAMASALAIASRALPNPNRPATRILSAGAVLQRIADELAEAVEITERGAHAVSFTVADRDADGAPERIRYAWDEDAGTQLTRAENGAAAVVLLDAVTDFTLAYTLRTETETYPGALADGPQTLLSSFDNSSNSSNFLVQKVNWCGQVITPALPSAAVSWTVDRVKFMLRKKSSDDGALALQVRSAGADGLPAATVLDSVTINETSLTSNYVWYEFTYAGASLIPAGSSAYLTIVAAKNKNENAEVLFNGNTGGGYAETFDSASTWQINSGKGIRHYIYGHYHAPGPDQKAVRRYVAAVEVALAVGADSAAALHTSVRTMNEPELLHGAWAIDAGQALAVDRNGDGAADFNTTTAFVMNPALLMDGSTSWTMPLTGLVATSAPDHDFNDLVTAEVRFRDLSVSDHEPAMFCLNVDWKNSYNAQIYAGVQLDSANAQSLLVSTLDAAGNAVALVQLAKLPTDPVDVRLLVDPDLNSVNVRVNGVDRGTFTYSTISRLTATKYVQFGPWDSTAAEFAHVAVRAGDRTP